VHHSNQAQKWFSVSLSTLWVAVQIGERLLEECCFVHLHLLDAKFNLLLNMLHKLYALVNLQCCEDDPDALTHHEILLPGHLLAKFFKEKTEDALNEFADNVRNYGLGLSKLSFGPGTLKATAHVGSVWHT
jgi:DNA-directed RNA polymerase beta subunit